MAFFKQLSVVTYSYLRRSKLPTVPISIKEIDGVRTRLLSGFSESELAIASLPLPRKSVNECASYVGLNTVGLLSDRLTILILRAIKTKSLTSVDDPKITEICLALENSSPGLSSRNTKVLNSMPTIYHPTFAQAYLSLVIVNTLLWEAQEVLYLRGPNALPDHELRDYIVFFSQENVKRNLLIENVDTLFWEYCSCK